MTPGHYASHPGINPQPQNTHTPMKDFFSKENIMNFLLIAVAAAVGTVIFAPYVAKAANKFMPKA